MRRWLSAARPVFFPPFLEKNADGIDVYTSLQYKNGKLYGSDGKQYAGNNADALKTLNDLNELKSLDDLASARITTLEKSKHSHGDSHDRFLSEY